MKIVVAHAFYRLEGGENRYVRQQVDLLSQRHEVELFGPRNESVSGLKGFADMTYSREKKAGFGALLDRFEPDIVHLHNAYPAIGPAVHLACEQRRIPLVQTIHNHRLRCPNAYMFTEGRVCRRCQSGLYFRSLAHGCFPQMSQTAAYATSLWVHRFIMKLEKKVSLFIAPSRFMQDRLAEWGVEGARVIPNFTEPATPTQPGDYGMYAGRLSSEKGVDVIVRALAVDDPPFKIVGAGPTLNEIKALAQRLGLKNTEFLGLQPAEEVDRLLSGARYLVMSSKGEEILPLAPIEAMARATAIVVSSIGGMTELGGLTFPPGDHQALASQLNRLEDEGLARELGEQGYDTWHKAYSPVAHLEMLGDAYLSVAR